MTKPLYHTVESKAQLLKENGLDVINYHLTGLFGDDQIVRIKSDCRRAVNILSHHFIEIEAVSLIQPCDKLTGQPQGHSYYMIEFATPYPRLG